MAFGLKRSYASLADLFIQIQLDRITIGCDCHQVKTLSLGYDPSHVEPFFRKERHYKLENIFTIALAHLSEDESGDEPQEFSAM